MINKVLAPVASIKNFINRGHDRSVQAKKNIISTFLIKGVSIAISLILVPLLINYINASRYGIWLTLSSIVGWFSFFDIGLTHGLRNKFAEAKAKGDQESACCAEDATKSGVRFQSDRKWRQTRSGETHSSLRHDQEFCKALWILNIIRFHRFY